MKKFTVRITGELRGNIWMPNTECIKEFNVVFAPEAGRNPFQREWIDLREALLDITNDGDFRSCGIDHAFIDTTFFYHGNRSVTISNELKPCKFIEDLFYNEKENQY